MKNFFYFVAQYLVWLAIFGAILYALFEDVTFESFRYIGF